MDSSIFEDEPLNQSSTQPNINEDFPSYSLDQHQSKFLL